MDLIDNTSEDTVNFIENINKKIDSALEKRHECIVLLNEIQNDILQCILLKRLSEAYINRVKNEADMSHPEITGHIDRSCVIARSIPNETLRKFYFKIVSFFDMQTDHSQDIGMNANNLFLISEKNLKCKTCGLPIPPGKKLYCSDLCRQIGNINKNEDDKMNTSNDQGKAPAETFHTDSLLPNPLSGEGDRNLDCTYYESCLDCAIIEAWEDFNCDQCALKNNVVQ